MGWRSIARELFLYVGGSLVVFAVDLGVYLGAFSVARPKYTFLFGNYVVVLLAAVGLATSLFVLARRQQLDVASARLAAACTFTGGLLLYGLHATVFTIVERSVSINVLHFLASTDPQPYDPIETNFVDTFVRRDRAVCKRLDEQVHLGNVVVEHGRYTLTAKGRRTLGLLDKANHATAADDPANLPSCRER